MRLRILLAIGILLNNIFGALILWPQLSSAAGSGVVISGLQTASKTSASAEYVELTNTAATSMSISGWQLQYRAASNGADCTKGWTAKATVVSGSVAPGAQYLFAPSAYLFADTSFSAGLAATGTIRLIDQNKVTVDALAWGAASCGTGRPAAAPTTAQILDRNSGADGSHGDNATDFTIQNQSAVQASSAAASATPQLTASAAATASHATGGNFALELTELLVDPAAPSTDAKDEFVEIHNAGTDPLDVGGYVIKTGTHSYKLPVGTIAPDGYMVITSGSSSISLTNSGGVANLLDPSGTVIDTAGAWESAVPGASWALIDGNWFWTLTPTPGAGNIYTQVPGTAGADDSTDYPAVELSELLPDPAAPLTDAADEFIEIYNPNPVAVNLEGYVLKTGHDLTGKYVIKGVTIPAGGYVALKSSTTKLALANDGSSVALYTPNGSQLGATVIYGKAKTGDSWAQFDTGWDWTSAPTPGAINILSAVSAAAAKPKATAKAKVAAKAKTTKAKAAAKLKTAKSTAKAMLAGTTSKGGRWLLFILASLTIGYIIYEFRNDIRNYYYKLRGYPTGRLAPIQAVEGRGGNRTNQRSRRG